MSEDNRYDESETDPAIEQELASWAAAEADRLGLGREQWVEPIHDTFTAAQRPHTTLLVSGLSLAHDKMVCSALRGLGYRVEVLDVPDNAALALGKEFGNRGQCNPTYFTVGNLLKHLEQLRDERGLTTEQIVENYVFLTAGACGPCRFGSYVTEYRKGLRDAGFEGFRMLLFQQQGGIKQATDEELGFKMNPAFAWGIVRALIAGDVLNLIGYRLRPYEVVPGSVNAAMDQCIEWVRAAFEEKKSVTRALWRCRRLLATLDIDRSQPKPLVSIIGEFWAMTTEGDGNYHLQRFLEAEGAEVDIQSLTNWLLFMIWENRHDTLNRMTLRDTDGSRRGLEGKNPTKKLWALKAADVAVRVLFHAYAKIGGLDAYPLPDMDEVAAIAKDHYDNDVRGGEGHMEVGKLIHFVEDRINHMTVSVKPFGCMPSSGVSDGVQSFVTARWPEAIFVPIETTGDGAVNVQSRVQMMLFKARKKAQEELDEALVTRGWTREELKERLQRSRRFRNPLRRPNHRVAGVAANLAYSL